MRQLYDQMTVPQRDVEKHCADGWKLYAYTEQGLAILGKRKPETLLNTADQYAAMREEQRKANIAAQMKWDMQQKLAQRPTRAQRHRQRLERQGDRA